MKKIYVFALVVIFSLINFASFAQVKKGKSFNMTVEIERSVYEGMKERGQLNSRVNYRIFDQNNSSNARGPYVPGNDHVFAGTCGTLPPLTYTNVTYGGQLEVDDATEGPIAIPFTFCFYGTNYNALYINSNGNITFGAGSTTFSSTGFPTSPQQMIAPFWADFDNGGGNGVGRVSIGPDYFVMTWDSIGYFNEQGDKRNTCTVIITDGLSTILPAGNNVGFFYDNMDWTTGGASGGTNGFGGTAATVGVNKGDGVNFIQIGRFDTSGTAFISNTALNNGVDWLDNKSFFFNLCTSGNNIAPVSVNYTSCDTVKLCGFSDTLLLENYFASPETDQVTTVTVSAPSLGTNISTFQYDPGASTHIINQIITTPALAGYHTLTYTATDNGTPAQTTNVSITLFISNPGMVDPIVFANPTGICPGETTTLTLNNCNSFVTHVWNNGTSGCNTTVAAQGTQYVTVEDANGCVQTEFINVQLIPEPLPVVVGDLYYCGNQGGTSLQLAPPTSAEPAYGNIIWNPGNVIGNNFGASAGTYTVTVTGVNGCINETSFSVEDLGPPAFTASNDTCLNAPVPVNLSLAFDCASSASCGVTTNTSCASSGTIVQFGTGTEQNDDTEYPTPFGNYYKNTKQQYLYKAADLLAAGVTPGVINSIAFNVLQNNGTTVYDGFTIKMMCTNATDLDTSSNAPFLTGAQTVFNPATINVALGWNTFTFNNNYAWDGTSNIVVEICNALSTNFTDNAQVQLSVMNYAASVYYRSDATPACPQTTHNYFTPWNGFPNAKYIPNTRFGVGSINAAAYTYSWNVGSPTGPVVATTQTTTVTPPAGGQTTYFVTVSATNSGVTCSRVDSVRILVSSSQPQIFPDGAVLCTDDAIMGLTVVGAPGGSWSHNTTSGTGIGGGITPNGGNVDFNPAISALGQSYVTYTVGAANCILKDSVLMVVNPAVVPNFVVPANYCSYDPAISFNTLPVSCYPGTTCQWKIDGTVATGIDPAVLTATTHTVTYTTDAGGNCPRTATQTINVHTAPVVTFSADTLSGCLPSVPVAFTSTVTTTPAASNAYTWSFGDASTANVANPVHVYSQAGVMSVSLNYTDINGCADNETKISYITINTIPEPEFVFEPANPTSLEPHVQFYNTSRNSTGLTWEWDIAGLDSADYFNISYDFPASGTYNIVLTATSPAGCVASYTSPVTVRPDYVIYIPSGFSPNGDGKNDVFLPKYSELMKEDYIMSIYDRWGEKIFQTSDIAEGWKGSKGNSDNIVSESGVYIYKIIYKDAYGKGHSETGHVNLVR